MEQSPMKKHPLLTYFIILILLCSTFVMRAKSLGPQGMMLVQAYMLTPAIAAVITRLFFYQSKFKDANLRFGNWRDYVKFWLVGLGITMLSYLLFTLLRSITWDFSGETFLANLAAQSALSGQTIAETVPLGFTPQMMLWLFFIGGLTVFNIFPGLITGFGEEFGHRGFMFPQLYKIHPWVGLIAGGLIWYGWHLPLGLIAPAPEEIATGEMLLNYLILAVGSICTFTYLAYVYVKSGSVFVTALAHITMNNAAASFSYLVTIQNQTLTNLGLTLTMLIVIAFLYSRGGLSAFDAYFKKADPNTVQGKLTE
jgi:membrane protease YdiL (CAAX protease family)